MCSEVLNCWIKKISGFDFESPSSGGSSFLGPRTCLPVSTLNFFSLRVASTPYETTILSYPEGQTVWSMSPRACQHPNPTSPSIFLGLASFMRGAPLAVIISFQHSESWVGAIFFPAFLKFFFITFRGRSSRGVPPTYLVISTYAVQYHTSPSSSVPVDTRSPETPFFFQHFLPTSRSLRPHDISPNLPRKLHGKALGTLIPLFCLLSH